MKDILARFRIPAGRFKQERELDEVVGAAKRCLDNGDGEVLLAHLINEFELDDPTGCLPADEANWRNGTQFVVKYILSLVTDNK